MSSASTRSQASCVGGGLTMVQANLDFDAGPETIEDGHEAVDGEAS